jgi:hypothetical protein
MSKKEVAVHEDKFPAGMEEFADAGMENMDADDFAVPFIKIIQKGSPIMDDPEANARPGMFINSVTNEVYPELILIPCGFKKELVQWAPRESGDGIRGTYDWDNNIMGETTPDEKGIPTLSNGDQIIETRYHYAYVIDPNTGETFPAIISMSSTQHTPSRRWSSTIRQRKMDINGERRTAPSFAFKYRAKTEMRTKDGNTWYVWTISPDSAVEEDWLMRECIAFYKSLQAGGIKAAEETRD